MPHEGFSARSKPQAHLGFELPFRNPPAPIAENQMETKIEHDMQTTIYWAYTTWQHTHRQGKASGESPTRQEA